MENCRQQFSREYQPIGPTEVALVAELARQTAASDRWSEAAMAVERQAACNLSTFANLTSQNAGNLHDAVLAGALSTENADRCERHSLARTRAFQRILEKFEQVQTRRKNREMHAELKPPPSFADEAACEQFLVEQFRNGKHGCATCGSRDGYFLASRHCWECGRCHAQVGLRSGTVMARSPISLWRWCEAIRWLLWTPTISVADLAQIIGIRRIATVREMAKRVRAAIAAADGSNQLAGLDHYFSRGSRKT